MVIHLDTSFLVDVIRESTREVEGPARVWLAENSHEQLAVSVPVLCEMLVGAELHEEPEQEVRRVNRICAGLPLVPLGERVPATYAKVAATLIRNGTKLAAMDLLIASTALSENAAILTRNVRHFERVPDLRVVSY